ncbi:MAG: hypothetical protein ACOCPZ_01925 [Natrialbaceae archaeon]
MSEIPITTTDGLDGYEVAEYRGLVSGEAVNLSGTAVTTRRV